MLWDLLRQAGVSFGHVYLPLTLFTRFAAQLYHLGLLTTNLFFCSTYDWQYTVTTERVYYVCDEPLMHFYCHNVRYNFSASDGDIYTGR